MQKRGVFGAVSKSDTVAISCWVCGGFYTVAKLAFFAIPPAAKVRGVTGADVAVKFLVRLASTVVGAGDVIAQFDSGKYSLYACGPFLAIPQLVPT